VAIVTPRRHLEIARIDALDQLLGRAPVAPPAPPPPLAHRAEEPARADEVLRDYVLAPYPPRRDPRGGLRAVNLLIESFALAGVEAEGVRVIERLRALLGVGRTVWGIKHAAGALSWELYVYDPGAARPEARIEAVCTTLAELIAPPDLARLPPGFAPHMMSLELDAAALRDRGAAHLTCYVHGADEPGASRSYALGPDGLRLANLYTFHDPRRDARALIARVRSSVHLGAAAIGVAAMLWPEVHRCRRLCVANKRAADGVYWSGVDTDQLAWFLAKTGWPAPLAASLDARRTRYGHLAWDVGVDFALAGAGGPTVTKSAIYATC
jgi:hypothetical protein